MASEVEQHQHPVYVETAPGEVVVELAAVMGEFTDVDSVIAAARGVRKAGFRRWDVHSPFPVHGIDRAMGVKPTILPWLTLAGGLTGLITGILLQGYTMGLDYPYIISGKPYLSWPAFVPVIFELTVLLAALATVFGMLGLNRLPQLYNPLLRSHRFRRATADRFFIVIDATDDKFDEVETPKLLTALGAVEVERVEDVIE